MVNESKIIVSDDFLNDLESIKEKLKLYFKGELVFKTDEQIRQEHWDMWLNSSKEKLEDHFA